jgi:hypothetical protein
LERLKIWKKAIQEEKLICHLTSYFAGKNNYTLIELLDEITLIYSNKSDEEKEKETGWRIPFWSNPRIVNEYIRKNNYAIKEEDVEKLENWCKKHPDEWSNTSHKPMWTDPNGLEITKNHLKSREDLIKQVKQIRNEQTIPKINSGDNWENMKPIWTTDEVKEKNLKSLNEKEMKDLMVIMDSFMKWIEPTLDELKTKEVDFNCSNIQIECEDFSECKDISQEKIEMGYYQLKKNEYLDKLKEWEKNKAKA